MVPGTGGARCAFAFDGASSSLRSVGRRHGRSRRARSRASAWRRIGVLMSRDENDPIRPS
jgi:hypothetical protein